MAKKKNSAGYVIGQIFKWLGIGLLIGAIVAVICYFTVAEFKTFVNNSWEDLKFQIENGKEVAGEAVEAVKRLAIR